MTCTRDPRNKPGDDADTDCQFAERRAARDEWEPKAAEDLPTRVRREVEAAGPMDWSEFVGRWPDEEDWCTECRRDPFAPCPSCWAQRLAKLREMAQRAELEAQAAAAGHRQDAGTDWRDIPGAGAGHHRLLAERLGRTRAAADALRNAVEVMEGEDA